MDKAVEKLVREDVKLAWLWPKNLPLSDKEERSHDLALTVLGIVDGKVDEAFKDSGVPEETLRDIRFATSKVAGLTINYASDWNRVQLLDIIVLAAMLGLVAGVGDVVGRRPMPIPEKMLVRPVAEGLLSGRKPDKDIAALFDFSTADGTDADYALAAKRDRERREEAEEKADKAEKMAKSAREELSRAKAQLGSAEMRAKKLESDVKHLEETVSILQQREVETTVVVDDASAELEAELAQANHRIAQLSEEVGKKRAEDSRLDAYRRVLEAGDEISPATPNDALALAEACFSGAFRLSKAARDDIASWQGRPKELWQALRALALQWLPQANESGPPLEDDFKKESGFRVSANESETTQTMHGDERTAMVEGERVAATHHLCGSSSRRDKNLRIYFSHNKALGCLDIVRAKHLSISGERP